VSVETWLWAFSLTAIVEIPIVVTLTRRVPLPLWRRSAIAFFAQLATHPAVWFIFPRIVGLTGREATWLSEVWAWLAEACLYAVAFPRCSPLQAIGVSAFANGASYAVGLMLHATKVF
jgi:hypothetical protein